MADVAIHTDIIILQEDKIDNNNNMENLGQIKTDTTWNEASSTLNANFKMIQAQFNNIGTEVKVPWFQTLENLYDAITYPYVGELVAIGVDFPLQVYSYNGSQWSNTGMTIDEPSVSLVDFYTKEQIDTLLEASQRNINVTGRLNELDSLNTYQHCGVYNVIDTSILSINTGTLLVFANNGGQVINQILFSAYGIVDGELDGGYINGYTTVCTRSYNIAGNGHPAAKGQWSKWSYIVTFPNELNPSSQDGTFFNVVQWSGIEVNGVQVQSISTIIEDGLVVYDTVKKSFLYLVSLPTGDMYYSNWPTRSNYQENTYISSSSSFSAGFKKNTLYVGTEQQVVMVASDLSTMQKVVEASTSQSIKKVAFAGVFTGSSDDISEGSPSTQEVYFLQDYGHFAIGEVTEATDKYSELEGHKRYKFIGQLYISPGSPYDEDYDTSNTIMLPKDNTIYYIEGRGMEYDIKVNDSGYATAAPRFTLNRGDCILKDGTFAFKEDAVSNHIDEIAGIIIDPIKKMMIPVPMTPITGAFVSSDSSTVSVLNTINNILATAEDAIAFDMALYSLKTAISGVANFASYFPAFYTSRWGSENVNGYKHYLATRAECTIAGEDGSVQYVIDSLNDNQADTVGTVFYGASPSFITNDLTAASSVILEGDVVKGNCTQTATSQGNAYLVVALYK